MICLDADGKGFGNCIGDQGSALIGKGTVIGMKAYSGKCPAGGTPDVFLRVSYFLPWLRAVAGEPDE